MIIPEVIPISLDFLGTLLIGFAVLQVHTKLGIEHQIDDKVTNIIHKEHLITIIGLILITLGFILQFF